MWRLTLRMFLCYCSYFQTILLVVVIYIFTVLVGMMIWVDSADGFDCVWANAANEICVVLLLCDLLCWMRCLWIERFSVCSKFLCENMADKKVFLSLSYFIERIFFSLFIFSTRTWFTLSVLAYVLRSNCVAIIWSTCFSWCADLCYD